MAFSSATFIYLFLPAALAVYYLLPAKARNAALLCFSLLFYFAAEQLYTLLLVGTSLLGWLFALYIERHRGTAKAKLALGVSVGIDVAALVYFKYAGFIVGTLNALPGISLRVPAIELPVGISFFVFQTISYTVDVARARVHAQRSLVGLATYVCLFPQLVAGPIVRYSDIDSQLQNRRLSGAGAAVGISRFCVGLGKKILIADVLAEFCAAYTAAAEPSVLFAWLSAVAFTLQIYFDFSGYSDMAIGLGKLLGFDFPENFDYPYISRSLTEFWRRWHMTLGSWFRDYVYIPLGGSRVSPARTALNLMAVWLLTGLWHGASWNFVVWGAYFGALLIAEKFFVGAALDKIPGLLRQAAVMLAVIVGFVIFNSDGMSGALASLGALVGVGKLAAVSFETLYYLRSYAVMFAVAALLATPAPKVLLDRLGSSDKGARALRVLRPFAVALLLALCTARLVSGSFNPFLYFRF